MTDVQRAMTEQTSTPNPQQELLEQLPEQLSEDLQVIDQVTGEREGTRWEHIALQQRMKRIIQAVVAGHKAQKQLQKEEAAEQIKQQFEGEVFEEGADTPE